MALLPALLALGLSAALFVHFVRLERAGRSLGAVLWLAGILLVDALFGPNPNLVPPGLLHPDLGPTNFRLVDTVALAAVAARILVAGLPARLSASAVWWVATLAWLSLGAVRGVLFGNSLTEVIYHSKAILYLGVMCVVAGVPRSAWRERSLDRFLVGASALVALFVLLSQAQVYITRPFPLVPLVGFGSVGADAATLATAFGLLALGRGLSVERGRSVLLIASGPLLVTPLVAGQRAALLGLLAGLLLFAALLVRGSRQVRVPGGDLLVAGGLVAVLLTAPAAVSAVVGAGVDLPLVQTVSAAIDSRGKQLSAQGRVNQWQEVRPELAERPLLGWGLGHTYVYYEPGPAEFVTSGLTHNVAGDLVLRTGAVGLLLFAGALTSTALAGLRRARTDPDPRVVALCIAAVAVLAGWAAKGMVESLFEKYRLAVLLGLVVGLILSLTDRDDSRRTPAAPAGSLLLPTNGSPAASRAADTTHPVPSHPPAPVTRTP